MAPDDDFDVEAWNRRLDETPGEPLAGQRATDGADPYLVGLDPRADPRLGTEATTEQGFPAFVHGQWTVEGEIERFGAFGRGAARAQGWRRTVACLLVALLVLPIALVAVQLVARVLG